MLTYLKQICAIVIISTLNKGRKQLKKDSMLSKTTESLYSFSGRHSFLLIFMPVYVDRRIIVQLPFPLYRKQE